MAEETEMSLIDLIKAFFSWVGKIFRKIGLSFLYFIRFSFRNIVILLAFLIIGIILAFITSSDSKKVYKADAIFMLNVGDAALFSGLTQSLNTDMISDQSLAVRLNIPEKETDNITKIAPHYVIDYFNNGTPDKIDLKDKFIETDTTNVRMKDRICIEVRTKDPYSFPIIQNGLMYFFNNNEYLKTAREIKVKHLQKNIDHFNTEIERLDKLSDFDYFKDSKPKTLTVDSQAILLGEKPRQLYYADMNKLIKSKDSVELLLMSASEVCYVSTPFNVSKNPVNSFLKMLIICGGISMIIGYIVALIIYYRKRMWHFLNEKPTPKE